MAEEEPKGLDMSLDDLIHMKADDRGDSGYGKQRRGSHQNGGRGGFQQRYDGHRQQFHNQGGRQGFQGGRGGGGQGYQQYGGGQRFQQGRGFIQQQHYNDPNAYRSNLSCYTEEGTLIFKFKLTEIVRVTPNGDITLDSGGYHNSWTVASMNDILNPIGIRVTSPGGTVSSGEWTITDGRALVRFHDGVILPGKGPAHAQRGKQLKAAFENLKRGAGSHQITAAAAAAAAAQGGMMHPPFTGMGGTPIPHPEGMFPPFGGMMHPMMMMQQQQQQMMRPFPGSQQYHRPQGGQRRPQHQQHQQPQEEGELGNLRSATITVKGSGGGHKEGSSVFNRLGGKKGGSQGDNEDWEAQRLQKQGRYHPY